MVPAQSECQRIADDIYGCLIAAAIGDALGAPVEGWYWTEIREKYGRVEEFMPFRTGYSDGSPGTYTDDSVLRHYLALCIVQHGRRITPDDWGEYWIAHVNTKRLWVAEEIARIKLAQGMNPWFTGRGNIPAGCAAMMIQPVGIVNAGNPRQAFQDGMNIAGVNQSGWNQEAAASVAAAQAEALNREATVDSIIGAMYDNSSAFMRRAYDLTMDLARTSDTVDSFAAKFYGKMLDWSWPQRKWTSEHHFSGNAHEFVPVVMAILWLCKGDVNECVIEGASFGRDCDTIAAVVGGLAGALQGAGAIRPAWIEQSEHANRPFFEEAGGDPSMTVKRVADRLVGVLEQETQAADRRAEHLRGLLGKSTQSQAGAKG
jgi:ADP-ribosylglycohydrolase